MSDCQLYLITPPAIADLSDFCQRLEQALAAAKGTSAEIACLQIRLKDAADQDVLEAARKILPLAHNYECAVLLNDRPDLALEAGADGAHIGQSDMDYAQARALLGADASIGVTCHNSRHLAMEAGEAGADYVAFGAFYPTATKAVTHQADPEILTAWSQMTTVPCVAIGGITPQNAPPLIDAGADFLAVSGSIWNHPAGTVAAIEAFAEVLSGNPAAQK